VLLAALIFAVVWPLRRRLPRPGELTWLVLGLFAVGRFFVFFVRSDSPALALGLSNTQWTSLGMLAVVVAGWALTTRRSAGDGGLQHPSARRKEHA
jgi:prolipoprotein diacylglyceryltransferase